MMLDFIGLFGMFCSQSVMRFFLGGFKFKTFHQDHIHMFCMLILVWRFFGLTSGCVAFIMAVDRFLAMAKPFFYWEYITYGLVKKSILIMWCICAFITFAPTIGFGLYFDDGKITKCQRYRNASKIVDIVYAWLLFVIGLLNESILLLDEFTTYIFFRNMLVYYDGGLQLSCDENRAFNS